MTTLELVDGTGAVVASGIAGRKGSTLSVPATAQSGLHGLRVAGDGAAEGDYRLQVAVKPRTQWSAAGSVLAGETAELRFSAPRGAVVRFDVRPARKSSFLAEVQAVDGPGEPEPAFVAGTPRQTLTVAATGDHVVLFRNAGADGEFTATASVKPPRSKPARLDVRATVLLGDPETGQAIVGRTFGPAGGSLDAGASQAALAGVRVDVPPGAVAAPTVFTAALAREFGLAGSGHDVGPTVALAPAGAAFSEPVTVTLPFDPAETGDPATELTVYTQDEATGAVTAVPGPYDFTGPPSTVRFTTTHFSKFQPKSAHPRGLEGEFLLLRLRTSLGADFGGDAGYALSRITIDPSGAWTGSGTGVGTQWKRNAGGGIPSAGAVAESLPTSGTRTVESDVVVRLAFDGGPTVALARRSSNGFLVRDDGSGFGTGGPAAHVQHSLYRLDPRAPTPSNVDGGWRFLRHTTYGHERAPGDVAFVTSSEHGHVDLRPDGVAEFEMSGVAVRRTVSWPGGASAETRGATAPVASWSVAGDVLLELSGTADPRSVRKGTPSGPVFAAAKTIRLVPVLDGQAMVGLEDAGASDPSRGVWFLVRDSATAARSDLHGPAAVHLLESYVQPVSLGSAFALQHTLISHDFDGAGGGERDSCPSGFAILQGGLGDAYVAPITGPCNEEGDVPAAISYLHPADGGYLDGLFRGVWTRDAKVFFGRVDGGIAHVLGMR